jgi:hypothetical protein
MKKLTNDQIISNAQRALALYRASKPGAGDMKSRRNNRNAASELIMPFLKKVRWSATYAPIAKKIDDALLEVI